MQSTATSAADVNEVWRVLADVERWPDWSPTMSSVEAVQPHVPIGVGTAYRIRQPRLPKAQWTVTEWRSGSSFTWIARAPGVTTTATHDVTAAAGGGTEIVLGLDWSGPMAPVARLIWGRLAQRYIATEARALAEHAAALR